MSQGSGSPQGLDGFRLVNVVEFADQRRNLDQFSCSTQEQRGIELGEELEPFADGVTGTLKNERRLRTSSSQQLTEPRTARTDASDDYVKQSDDASEPLAHRMRSLVGGFLLHMVSISSLSGSQPTTSRALFECVVNKF